MEETAESTAAASCDKDIAEIKIAAELHLISLDVEPPSSEVLASGDSVLFELDANELSIVVGSLELFNLARSEVEITETQDRLSLMFPESDDRSYSLMLYPREDEHDKLEVILRLFDRLPELFDKPAPESKEEVKSAGGGYIAGAGAWLAGMVVQESQALATYMEEKGHDYVQGAERQDVAVDENVLKAMHATQTGAGYVLGATGHVVSALISGAKTVGSAAVTATQKSGALDALGLKDTGEERENDSGAVRMVVDVASETVTAVSDVTNAVSSAFEIIVSQSERTVVQVAGDLYGDDVAKATQAGVGTFATIGRTGMVVMDTSVSGVAVNLSTAVTDRYTLPDFVKANPVLEGRLDWRNPLHWTWHECFASLSSLGILLYDSEEDMKARSAEIAPRHIIDVENIRSIDKLGLQISIREWDHSSHELCVPESSNLTCDEWHNEFTEVHKNSRAYQALFQKASVQSVSRPAPSTAETTGSHAVVLKGWLQKRGPVYGFKWQQRWCTLTGCKLGIFRSEVCEVAIATVELTPASVAMPFSKLGAPGDAVKHKTQCPFGFILDVRGPQAGPSRHFYQYYFDACNLEELNAWVDAITLAIPSQVQSRTTEGSKR
eukprot:TRINITY_DN49100_c0_g1_i1.p1 TRINITY_DN49100_c0_g1~~TRINITY_DN49100_c0_g1_i1.p1  ORF type:complete len:610 (+),score=94.54 TRINITY_DN49100_c0_g1_i1:40-1869(+)